MRIVVTGATGFIGCQLAQILAGLGHDLVATGRATSAIESARVERLEKAGVRVGKTPSETAQLVRDIMRSR